MKPERLPSALPTLDGMADYDACCCLVTEDERPLPNGAGFIDWRLCGALSRALKSGFFSGTPGERLLLPTAGQLPFGRVFAVGLGHSGAVTALGLDHALRSVAIMLVKAQIDRVALAFPTLPTVVDSMRDDVLLRAFETFSLSKVAVFA